MPPCTHRGGWLKGGGSERKRKCCFSRFLSSSFLMILSSTSASHPEVTIAVVWFYFRDSVRTSPAHLSLWDRSSVLHFSSAWLISYYQPSPAELNSLAKLFMCCSLTFLFSFSLSFAISHFQRFVLLLSSDRSPSCFFTCNKHYLHLYPSITVFLSQGRHCMSQFFFCPQPPTK